MIGAPESRLSLGRSFGVDETFELNGTTPEERKDRILSLTTGRGVDVVIEAAGHPSAIPEGFDPDPTILARAREATSVTLTRDPMEAAEGAHVLTTDTWVSMGQEEEAQDRIGLFQPFQVTQAVMDRGHPEAIFLHCLPAYRGKEVAAEVIDGPQSRVLDEAENRLHVQKAILLELMG